MDFFCRDLFSTSIILCHQKRFVLRTLYVPLLNDIYFPPFFVIFFSVSVRVSAANYFFTAEGASRLEGGLNPFRTAVPFWGQTTWKLSCLSPKRDCGSKRVKCYYVGFRVASSLSQMLSCEFLYSRKKSSPKSTPIYLPDSCNAYIYIRVHVARCSRVCRRGIDKIRKAWQVAWSVLDIAPSSKYNIDWVFYEGSWTIYYVVGDPTTTTPTMNTAVLTTVVYKPAVFVAFAGCCDTSCMFPSATRSYCCCTVHTAGCLVVVVDEMRRGKYKYLLHELNKVSLDRLTFPCFFASQSTTTHGCFYFPPIHVS